MNWLQAFKLLQNHLGSLNILDGLLEHKSFIALSPHSFPHVSTSFYSFAAYFYCNLFFLSLIGLYCYQSCSSDLSMLVHFIIRLKQLVIF
jgi:hypothetical protein